MVIVLLPAVSAMETSSKVNSVSNSARRKASVKIRTHKSKEPMSSLTEVKFLSNPTSMTATK